MLKSVLSSGNLLLSLLNDILDLSKIEAGKLDISLHPVDLKNVLHEINQLFNDKAQKKGFEINIFIPNDFPDILLLDEIRIKQVIFNLVGNAVKFTNQGYVNMKVSFMFQKAVSGELTIEIDDTGIGIPESQQELIFNAFAQQSGQSNRTYGGVGLGLAISKRLVEKMNGTIKVKSQVGQGSMFIVKLPEVEVGAFETRQNEFQEELFKIEFENAKILVIDDVSSNVEIIETFLSSTVLVVSSAENGEVGLEILTHIIPDLILLDLRMPGIDGYETAKIIKSSPTVCHIPIIAFTASVFSTDKIKSSGHFDGVLLKPVNQSELFAELAKFLKHKKVEMVNNPEKAVDFNFDDLSEDIKSAFPQIVKALNEELMPSWENVRDQLVLFKIEEFADELNKFAMGYKFKILSDYAEKLANEVEILDLEALKVTLNDFPRLIEKIIKEFKNKRNE